MSKYSSYSRRASAKPRPWRVHPIWRGIGCIFMIIVPIMSYAGAILLVQWDAKTRWIPIPKEFARTITIPFVDWRIRYFGANLIVTLVLAMVGFAVLMSLYALVYRAVGPQRSPLDAPPIRRKTRRSR
jgi:hypothetical protein